MRFQPLKSRRRYRLDHEFALIHSRSNRMAERAGDKSGEIRLCGARIESALSRPAIEKGRRLVWHPRRLAARTNPDRRPRHIARNRQGDVAATRNGRNTDQQHVERELHEILADGCMWRFPHERRLFAFHQTFGDGFRISKIKLRARRTRRTESQPCKLQLR